MLASREAAQKAYWDFLGLWSSVSSEGNSVIEGSMLQASPTFLPRKRTTSALRCRPASPGISEKLGFLMMSSPQGPGLHLSPQLAHLLQFGLGCWVLSSCLDSAPWLGTSYKDVTSKFPRRQIQKLKRR